MTTPAKQKVTIPIKTLADGFQIPALGLGTWGMGGEYERDEKNDATDIKIIKQAISLGMTNIDTAEKYAAGHAEELVGTAIKGADRKKLFIVSKVWEENLHYDDVMEAADKSLKRLGTDYIDLYLVHMRNFDIPLKETMKAMDLLK